MNHWGHNGNNLVELRPILLHRDRCVSEYKIGEWTANPTNGLLTRGDETLYLSPHHMDVLMYLASRANEVVSIEEILETVWSGSVTGDYAVHDVVSKLRRAFNDDAKRPAYIKTVPRRGYQLIAAVSRIDRDQSGESDAESVSDDKRPQETAPIAKPSVSATKGAIIAAFVITALVIVWYLQPQPNEIETVRSDIRSIAVLPLENLSRDPEQQYFANGMTATLIGDLGKIRALHVVSRRSVLRYANTDKSLPEIARELNVDAIIEGAVMRDGERVRINLELIDGHTDRQLWSDRYEGHLSDVLALQGKVARTVAEQVRIELSPDEQQVLKVTHTVDALAFDAYLRGLQIATAKPFFTVGDWGPQVIKHYKNAVALDPEFTDAWKALGSIQLFIGRQAHTRTYRGELANAKNAIQKALDLGDQQAETQVVLGNILLYVDWDIDAARRAFDKALALSPLHPTVLIYYANFIWQVDGNVEEALSYSARALRLAPFSSHVRRIRIWMLLMMRRYEQMQEEMEQTRRLIPNFITDAEGLLYSFTARASEEAGAELRLWKHCGTSCDAQRALFESVWASGGGMEEYNRQYLGMQQSGFFEVVSPWVLGILYGEIGETDTAIDWLERGVEERDPALITGLRNFPLYDLLRFEPRFQNLVYRVTGKQVLDEDPRILAGVVQTWVRAGKAAEAIPHLETAIELHPEDRGLPRWLYYLSLAHFVEKRYEESLSWAERALEQGGEDYNQAFTQFVRASSLAHLDRMDEARQALDEAVRLWPGELEMERDLRYIFTIREPELQNRYLSGLRKAGLSG